jgi:hypothetical protein
MGQNRIVEFCGLLAFDCRKIMPSGEPVGELKKDYFYFWSEE